MQFGAKAPLPTLHDETHHQKNPSLLEKVSYSKLVFVCLGVLLARMKGTAMSALSFLKGTHGLLLGAGVAIGSVGVKVLTSDSAKRLYVKAVAAGLRAKSACEDTLESARAEVDDIIAEASYLNETTYRPDAQADGESCESAPVEA